jgi:hypothetical protein
VVGHVRFPADAEANYLTVSEETHRWKCLLEDGEFWSAGQIADARRLRSFVNGLLRLTLLAPDIQESVLDGRQPKGLQLVDLTKGTSSSCEEQEKLAHFG